MTPPAQKNARGAGLGDDRGHVAALFAAEMERLADENRRLYEHIGRIAYSTWVADEAARDREKADEFQRQFERAARADEEARAEAERRKEQAKRAAQMAEEERLREERRKHLEAAAEAARDRARQAAAEVERLLRQAEKRMREAEEHMRKQREEREEREARERARKAEEERRREEQERARREKAEKEARERAEAERLRREEEERRRQEQAQKEAREREARRRAAEAERARREQEQRQRTASALDKYDLTWKTISAGNIPEPLTFAEFPWPMSTIPSCHHEEAFPLADIEKFLLSTLQTNGEKCKAIRRELTRWHPDKINIRVLMQIASKDMSRVKAAAVCITRVLIRLLEKFNSA